MDKIKTKYGLTYTKGKTITLWGNVQKGSGKTRFREKVYAEVKILEIDEKAKTMLIQLVE